MLDHGILFDKKSCQKYKIVYNNLGKTAFIDHSRYNSNDVISPGDRYF